MDSDLNDALGISGGAESKEEKIHSSEDIQDEKYLKTVASAILTIGIFCSLVLFFSIVNIRIPGSEYSEAQTLFSWTGFVICLSTLMSSIGLYYFLLVLGNISISLKELNKSQKLKN